MFGLFSNKKKQEALDKEQKEYIESVEKLLALLHPNVREVFAKDANAFESYMQRRDRTVPISILFLMSQAERILDRLKSLEGELSSAAEKNGDNS